MSIALEGIAIVGLAGRFPGARNVAEFWSNLIAGRETISTIENSAPDTDGLYIPRRGLIERPEWFDAAFFGISPNEATAMDPQQRVFLEECWSALEDAACDPIRFSGAIGVYAGMSNNTYWRNNIIHHPELIDKVGALTAMMGNEKDYLATRVAYKLNLRGPAINIYTACSTSLVAVCQAVQALLNFNCDIALAGGVSITFPHERGYLFDEGGIVSPDGHCQPFDIAAAGTVFSNGVGVAVLKRLEDAVADGDHIYAVIKGAALNNDGSHKVSFTAPSVEGHTGVITLAHALAGVDPRTIGFVEAHGTGTPLGDPIEIAGLTSAFRAGTDNTGFCGIGSVKSNIGHLDAAAGIAGLIKAALCVKHGLIPPSLHFTKPNPDLHIEDSPFFVADRLRQWPDTNVPRRCGVSSFGVGGTNAHCVLESHSQPDERSGSSDSDCPLILPISAKSESALAQLAANLADHIEENPGIEMADTAHTLQSGRAEFAFRQAHVIQGRDDAISRLRSHGAACSQVGSSDPGGIVFMFPGQGSQYPGMGGALYAKESVFRDALDECCELFRPELGLDLRQVIYPGSSEPDLARAKLRETLHAQPAVFSISYALAQLWKAWGITPSACIGHSIGEYAAATVAGVFHLPDAVRLVAARAKFVSAQARGAMLAVRLREDQANAYLNEQIALASVNAPSLCVLSGPERAIASIEIQLTAEGIATRHLETSHAFHSHMMDTLIEDLAIVADSVPRNAPRLPILSTVSGEWLDHATATNPRYWARHIRETVRFSSAISKLLGSENKVFIECGPGATLAQLTRQHRVADRTVVESIREDHDDNSSLRKAAARLWERGCTLEWTRLHRNGAPRRISLPTYPFERKRFFADAPASHPLSSSSQFRDTEHVTEAAVQKGDPAPTCEVSGGTTHEIIALLGELSGTEVASINPNVSFTELGFDSLFLTQVAVAVFKRFGVKLTLRQLLQEIPTPRLLAEHIESRTSPRPQIDPPPDQPS